METVYDSENCTHTLSKSSESFVLTHNRLRIFTNMGKFVAEPNINALPVGNVDIILVDSLVKASEVAFM
jgi:hypothetical protein